MTNKKQAQRVGCLGVLRLYKVKNFGLRQFLLVFSTPDGSFVCANFLRLISCPVGLGCRIHRLHLCRGVQFPQRMSCYYSKPSESKASVMLKLWGMQSTPSLLSLPGSIWLWVVAPDLVIFIEQIERNCVIRLNWIAWNLLFLHFTVVKKKLYLNQWLCVNKRLLMLKLCKIKWNYLIVSKERAQICLKIVSLKCWRNHISNICTKKI